MVSATAPASTEHWTSFTTLSARPLRCVKRRVSSSSGCAPATPAQAQPEDVDGAVQDGQWLSLIGGYRHEDAAVLEWQMNRSGLPRHSLSTALRASLLDHEIARGTRVVRFKGGTPHSISHWLQVATMTDIVALRQGTRGETLRRLSHLLPESNFLGRTLADPALDWKHTGRAA